MAIKLNCTACGEEATPFRFRQCEACVRAKRRVLAKAWYGRNRGRMKEIREKYNNANPEKMMWFAARQRARSMGRAFDISLSDIVIPAVCPVLGIALCKATKGIRSGADASPSLDRIDNSRGYEKGNVAVISYRANRLKADATAGELERVAMYMAGHTS